MCVGPSLSLLFVQLYVAIRLMKKDGTFFFLLLIFVPPLYLFIISMSSSFRYVSLLPPP